MRITNAGKVGIGTTGPNALLHLEGSSSPQLRLDTTSDANGANINYFDSGNTLRGIIGWNQSVGSTPGYGLLFDASAQGFNINGTRAMTITGGNVGIGTTSPSVTLEVVRSSPNPVSIRVRNSGSGSAGVHIDRGATSTDGNVLWYTGGTLHWRIRQPTGSSDLRVFDEVNSVNVMSFQQGGNVGIGTTSPISKLEVNGGDIRVTGGSFIDDGTTLNVPDYVFEPDYKLESIEEHAEFMWREKHLPAVKSAKEIKGGNGYNTSERREQILEELEKAHVYIEKLHNSIQELKAENEDTKAENTELKAEFESLKSKMAQFELTLQKFAAVKPTQENSEGTTMLVDNSK